MNKFGRLLVWIIFVLAIKACADEGKEKTIENRFSHSTWVYKKSYQDCLPKNDDCTYIRFEYPEFLDMGSDQVLKSLQSNIESILLTDLAGTNPQTSAEIFIQDYADFLSESDEDYVVGWYDERYMQWVYTSPKMVSLMFVWNSYYGGAHPNVTITYYNYDPVTGKKMELKDVFTSDGLASLQELAEQEFRVVRELDPEENLEEAGFWFDEGRFELSNNFTFTDSGILFYYNPYEIASYADGPTEVMLPFDLIKPLMK
jgi:hypothetical protein